MGAYEDVNAQTPGHTLLRFLSSTVQEGIFVLLKKGC